MEGYLNTQLLDSKKFLSEDAGVMDRTRYLKTLNVFNCKQLKFDPVE